MRVSPAGLLVSAALVSATALNFGLGMQLRHQRDIHARDAARWRLLSPGMFAPRGELELLTGSRRTIGEAGPGQCQLLFIYNTSCPFCEATRPAWQALAATVSAGTATSVLGLSLDSPEETAEHARAQGLNYEVALLSDERVRSLLRAGSVPQTLLIGWDGRVLYSRPGVLTPAAADSLQVLVSGSGIAGRYRCGEPADSS